MQNRTIEEVIRLSYHLGMIPNSVKRGHKAPDFNEQELLEWVTSQPHFNKLWDDYVASGYNRMKVPSLDRLDESIGYKFSNIELVTWEVNANRAWDKLMKPVAAYTLKGKLINSYESFILASQSLGVPSYDITNTIKGRQKYTQDYQFIKVVEGQPILDNIEPVKERYEAIAEATSMLVIRVDLVTGEEIVFKSQPEAAASAGISTRGIRSVLSGAQKTAGGYFWKKHPEAKVRKNSSSSTLF